MILHTSRDGLEESELKSLVESEIDASDYRDVTWEGVRARLEDILTVQPHDAGRKIRLTTWARDAVEDRYFCHGTEQWHIRLARMFQAAHQEFIAPGGNVNGINDREMYRGIKEWLYHIDQAAQWKEIRDVVSDPGIVKTLLQAKKVNLLKEYYLIAKNRKQDPGRELADRMIAIANTDPDKYAKDVELSSVFLMERRHIWGEFALKEWIIDHGESVAYSTIKPVHAEDANGKLLEAELLISAARASSAKGRLGEALEIFGKAIYVFEKKKMQLHEGHCEALVGRADCLVLLKRLPEALLTYQKAKKLILALGNLYSDKYVHACMGLAAVRRRMANQERKKEQKEPYNQEAIVQLRSVVEVLTVLAGASDPRHRRALMLLADTLSISGADTSGEATEAMTIYNGIKKQLVETVGVNDPAYMQVIGAMALLHAKEGRQDDAKALYQEALKSCEGLETDSGTEYALGLINAGRILYEAGELQDATFKFGEAKAVFDMEARKCNRLKAAIQRDELDNPNPNPNPN